MNVQIKQIITQYKGDTNMFGSPNLDYVYNETTNPSFYFVQKMKGCNL